MVGTKYVTRCLMFRVSSAVLTTRSTSTPSPHPNPVVPDAADSALQEPNQVDRNKYKVAQLIINATVVSLDKY